MSWTVKLHVVLLMQCSWGLASMECVHMNVMPGSGAALITQNRLEVVLSNYAAAGMCTHMRE